MEKFTVLGSNPASQTFFEPETGSLLVQNTVITSDLSDILPKKILLRTSQGKTTLDYEALAVLNRWYQLQTQVFSHPVSADFSRSQMPTDGEMRYAEFCSSHHPSSFLKLLSKKNGLWGQKSWRRLKQKKIIFESKDQILFKNFGLAKQLCAKKSYSIGS